MTFENISEHILAFTLDGKEHILAPGSKAELSDCEYTQDLVGQKILAKVESTEAVKSKKQTEAQ